MILQFQKLRFLELKRPQENYNNRYSEQNLEQSNKYATQFKSMQNEYDYFTDVENYSSNIEDTVVVVYDNDESSRNYAGWGNNSSDVTIKYYNISSNKLLDIIL